MKKTVIIDNYDSFTYNLSHLLKELGAQVTVYRNDKFQLEELEEFDKIILSPGPCNQNLCWAETHPWSLFGTSGNRTSLRSQADQSKRRISWCGNLHSYYGQRLYFRESAG